MLNRFPAALLLSVAALTAAGPAWAGTPKKKDARIAPVPVAKLAYVDGLVEQQPEGGSFSRAREAGKVNTGDHLRTGTDGTARVEYPWTSLVLGPSSQMAIPSTRILATLLDSGRLEQRSDAEVMKLQTPEATVRGKGRLVVRREGGHTAVTVIDGVFRVEAQERIVELRGGQGTIVASGRPPEDHVQLPTGATSRHPGEETRYVKKGEPVELRWTPATPAHVQILSLDREDVLLQRDVDGGAVAIPAPWLGTYRWRVSLRDAGGLESPPSPDGLVCIVEE
jgi:hypothetical protein